jgi:hypothetical protein
MIPPSTVLPRLTRHRAAVGDPHRSVVPPAQAVIASPNLPPRLRYPSLQLELTVARSPAHIERRLRFDLSGSAALIGLNAIRDFRKVRGLIFMCRTGPVPQALCQDQVGWPASKFRMFRMWWAVAIFVLFCELSPPRRRFNHSENVSTFCFESLTPRMPSDISREWTSGRMWKGCNVTLE